MALGLASDGVQHLLAEELVAPPLLWSERRSTLHEAFWRHEISMDRATRVRAFLRSDSLRAIDHPDLDDSAWHLAEQMGWAKTYDAEYVALARLLECWRVTLDRALYRGTRRRGFVVAPEEI